MNLRFNQLLTSIKRHQIFTESCNGQDNGLPILKIKSIFVFNIFFILAIIPILLLRINQGNKFMLIIDSLTILFLVFSCLLIYFKKYELSTFITVVIIPSLGFTTAFLSDSPVTGIFSILCLMQGIFIMVLPSLKIKIMYTLSYSFALILLFLKNHDNPYMIYPTLMLIIAFTILFILFSDYLEKQNKSLINIKMSLKDTNLKLVATNHSLVNKNDDLKTFSHIMSHDLKAPARTVISYTGLLKRKLKLQEGDETAFFHFIENAGKEMITLIDELMLFQKVEQESIVLEKLDLHQLLEDLKSNYLFEIENNKLHFTIRNIPNIHGNSTFIKILMNNLISNAIKYQHKKLNHIPNIKIEGEETEDLVIIYFSDNGIGIDQQYIDILFEPFKRYHSKLDYNGTGLGMTICKKVMDKQMGSIEVLKTSLEGTTFKLSFMKTQ